MSVDAVPSAHERPPEVVYAGLWARAGAFLFDVAVFGVLAIPIERLSASALGDPALLAGRPLSTVLTALAFVAYLVVTTRVAGGTLGKLALGLRVVTTESERPDWLTVVFREVVGRIIVTATFGLGYLWIAVDPRKQGWHDRIAETLVLRRVRPAGVGDPWADEMSATGRHRPVT